MKYYRQYVLNEREDVKSIDLEFGTALHLAIKTYFDGGDPVGAYNMYWNSLDFSKFPEARFSPQDLSVLALNKFMPNFIKLHAKKFTDFKQEETLEMDILFDDTHDTGSHRLQGTYDMLCDYEGVPTLVDWKTSAREYPKSKIEKNPQLYIYAALCKEAYGILPKQIMYKVFIKSEGRIQTLKLELTEEKLALQMKNVSAIIDNIIYMTSNKQFYSNYNCYCKGCLA